MTLIGGCNLMGLDEKSATPHFAVSSPGHSQLSWEWPGDSVLCNMHHEASSPGLPGPGEETSLCSFPVLCAICTMKPPPQALPGPGEEPSWHFVLVSVMFL